MRMAHPVAHLVEERMLPARVLGGLALADPEPFLHFGAPRAEGAR